MRWAQGLFTGWDRMAKAVGRPRGFDAEAAVREAKAIFWRQGFHATSLATLAAAIGVHKPSLYAAYGDKRDLYLAAYDAYQSDAAKLVAGALCRTGFREALTTFFTADIDLFLADDARGCFMLATALPLAPNDEGVADRVRNALTGLHQALARRVDQARLDDELSPTIEPATATDVIVSTHVALANRARSGEARSALEMTARRVIDLVCR